MPTTPTYPGVYIEEVSSGVRTITPVATSITAFVGSAPRGLANSPVTINSFADYERNFGGLSIASPMSYAVSQYFQNGGAVALIIRVTHSDALPAKVVVGEVPLQAASAGEWGNLILVRIDHDTSDKERTDATPVLFNLSLYDIASRNLEVFRNLSTDLDSPRYVGIVLDELSTLARLDTSAAAPPLGRPGKNDDPQSGSWFDPQNTGSRVQMQGGTNGATIDESDLMGKLSDKTGMYALEKADLFNLLCLPPTVRNGEIQGTTYSKALAYCLARRAMLIVDAPGWNSVDAATKGIEGLRRELGSADILKNAAIFFPRLKMSDPLKENRLAEFAPCGAVAGICARTDVARGVWKAPAGIEAGFSGVREFTVGMTDAENGQLNPLGVNCLRFFRAYGNVVWGSRTMAGEDRMASEWKYLPVRRFTLFLEESLYRGTQWVVFEPNDEPLWAQIRLNIGAFMRDLFRQGAFQGRTPAEAYFVKCDKETTTQSDINRGIVNIEVGFAPLKPAEFVIVKIQQIAGRIET